jgi:hypothetical protein
MHTTILNVIIWIRLPMLLCIRQKEDGMYGFWVSISRLICDNIESLLHKYLSVKVKVIIAQIRDKFNYPITYIKAWIAKIWQSKRFFEHGKIHMLLFLSG